MATKKQAGDLAREAIDEQERDFLDHRQSLAAFDFRELQDWAHRTSLASRKRRRLLEKVGGQNGFSLEQLDALHAADAELVLRQLKARQASATALLKRHHKRQRAALQTVIKHRERFEYQAGNPIFQTCMWTAANATGIALFPFTFNQGTAGLEGPAVVTPPPTVGNNLAQFNVGAHANATGSLTGGLTPVAGLELLTSHVFTTVARSDGILSVTAHYAPLGSVTLFAPGDCVGFGGSASFVLTLLMDVSITGQNGRLITVPRGEVKEIVNERVHAGCDAETRFLLVGPTGGESYQLINNDLGAVDAGDTIRVNARFALRVSSALRGSSVGDFSGGPSALNVPLVVAKIET